MFAMLTYCILTLDINLKNKISKSDYPDKNNILNVSTKSVRSTIKSAVVFQLKVVIRI